MKIRKYVTLNLIALISYIHLWQTIFRYEFFPFTIWSNKNDLFREVFEDICHYNVYKFRLHHDFILEIIWIVLFLLFFFELIFKRKHPNKLKDIKIENKVLNIVHGMFFYFSYIYMFYVCSIYLFYLLFILFLICIIFI